MRYRFEQVVLDTKKRELTRAGVAVPLQPKVFDLLLFLVEHRGRLVTRQELLDAVWEGTIVGDAAISRAIKEVRRAVGDDGEAQRLIKTMHGRGFRFVGELVPVDSLAPPSAPPVEDEFIGREAPLRQLESLLDGGRAAVIAGEAGIGKSFLLERFGRVAAARGFEVHHARCSEADGVPALWPWEQLVRSVGGTVPSELAPLLGTATAGDDAHARFRLHDGCMRFLVEIARTRPLVLLVDDLHLADEASLALLQGFVPRLRGQRLVIVAAARAASVPGATTLSLEGFGPAEVAAFFERETGAAPVAATVDALREWTGGNPLFLSHLVHLTEAMGQGSQSARLPRALRDAVDDTLAVLGEEARAVLAMGAVVGAEFRLVVVAKAMGKNAADLLDAIGEALEHRIVRRVAQRIDTFAFIHGVLRDALYAHLSLGERARRHALVGDALESVYGAARDEHAEELAHHYLRGAPAERADEAVRFATLAGDHAVARAAFEHAVTLYRAALDALPLAGSAAAADKARILVRLGSALGRDGRLGEAGPLFRQAAVVAEAPAPFVENVAALRSSFEQIVTRAPEVTTRFYDRLFAEHPDLRALFHRNSPPVQAKMMNDTLLAIIDRLEDAPWLRASLAALGARHVAYGVTDEMYPRVGASLLATLAEAAGPDVWTPPVAEAWSRAFDAITSMMLDGARPRRSSAA